MIVMVIPFVAEGVANDWPQAVACLERTLGSILANPEPDLRVLVVCQDRPPVQTKDSRYLFVQSNRAKPDRLDKNTQRHDKGWKVADGFAVARELRPDFIMQVDADDLISNKLVAHVRQYPEFDAFCFKVGFEWRQGSSYFTIRSYFNQYCGSTFIWRFNEKLFPAWLGGDFQHRRVGDQSHEFVEKTMDESGFRVQKIWQPKVVSVTGHGNNLGHRLTWRRRIKDLLFFPWRSRKITPALRQEFNLG